MKKRNIMIFSVVALLALLVVGGTMAWFTSTPAEVINRFKAGTVKIKVNEHGFEDVTNVNPGDTHLKKVTVESLGSKQTYVRVKLTPVWTPGEAEEGQDQITLPDGNGPASYEIGNDWVVGETDQEDGGTWYYYKHIMGKGEDPMLETTALIEGVKFDGENMNNDYQGATFTLKVEAQAVQASHYAFRDEWEKPGNALVPAEGVEEWTE